jgi:uncharacterized protein YwgA
MENPNGLLYILLYARGKSMRDNESVPTKTHLQKEIFMLQRIYPFSESKNKYEFIPLYYGPFSKELAMDLNEGTENGFISSGIGISLTSQGFSHASSIWSNLSDEYKQTVIKIKEEFNRMTINQLIEYVYEHNPKFTKKSALLKDVVDDYFDQFWKENQLSDKYFEEVVRKNRD